ncbi:MAG: hypothetical protein H0T62_02330 [Parachlamydiaceae bacterium]|nr:hypothetical protein [Parachlamydiaceae bacterium]
MSSQDHYIQAKFGIDEIFIHEEFTNTLLEKLKQRAAFSLDGEDNVVQKYAMHDMILIFRNELPSPSLIYRFLKFLDQDVGKANFIKSNILCDENELFPSIKIKNYILITPRILLKEMNNPC